MTDFTKALVGAVSAILMVGAGIAVAVLLMAAMGALVLLATHAAFAVGAPISWGSSIGAGFLAAVVGSASLSVRRG